MSRRALEVLIVGAGVAGSTLAALLGRDGHRVQVVEKDQGVRSSGNPVDVRGGACDLLDRLGVLSSVKKHATHVDEVVFVDDVGAAVGTLRTQRRRQDFEVSRSVLAAAALDAARPFVEIRFDDTVTAIDQTPGRVEVQFARSPSRSFDLVVGADGVHSTTRRIVFGPETRFVRPFGMYVAGFRLDDLGWSDDATVVVHNAPGRSASVHPVTGDPVAALIFRSPERVDPRDRRRMQELISDTYRGGGWRDQELLDRFTVADDPYVDQISRVSVPSWSVGRVTLLGDAASGVSLFGEGSSSAVLGAARLADQLSDDQDIDQALINYQRLHERQVRRGQRSAGLTSHLLVPATPAGLGARNVVLRLARTTRRAPRRER